MGHASRHERESDRIPMNGFQSHALRPPDALPFSRSLVSALRPSLFVIVTLFSANLDGQASYANCRFFWPENQLWPAVQQVSWWWVTANFYLSTRATEAGNEETSEREKERKRKRVGERGCTRSSASGRESISSPRKNATPPAASPRRLDPLFGIADFFLSLPLFSIRTRRPL